MNIRFYYPGLDFEKMNELLLKRDIKPVTRAEIPEHGFVVEKDNIIVAMGFLRKCEGQMAIMDSFVTNPDASMRDRHDALNLIFKEMIEFSKQIEIFHLVGFTFYNGLIQRLKKFGFNELEHRVVSLKIEGT